MKSIQDPLLKYWLVPFIVLTCLLVVIGGITRLTGSGLSMVDWQPLYGFFPPLTHAQWMGVFTQYQLSPQYQTINLGMSLSDFKSIFFWEYIHRVLGRIVGLVALIPFLMLWRKRLLPTPYIWGGALLSFGVLCQGLMGWYMVKSGLVDIPQVSHYRLAAHLLLAFTLISGAFWMFLSRLSPSQFQLKLPKAHQRFAQLSSVALLELVGWQLLYGAFMAGLKAGHLYPTFPKMGSEWIPSAIWMHTPWWQNFLSNPFMIHFIHRILAYAIVIFFGIVLFRLYRQGVTVFSLLPYKCVAILLLWQFMLGILTVLFDVTILLAVLHQLSGLLLLLFTVLLVYANYYQKNWFLSKV